MDIRRLKLSAGVSLAMLAMGAYFIIIDIAVPIVVRVLGYDETAKGIILMVVNGLPLIFYPLSAKLSDKSKSRHGRRTPFIFCGITLCAAGLIAAAFAARAGSIWGFAVMVTVSSFAIAVYRPAAQSLQPDVIPPEFRSTANSVSNVVMGTSNFVVIALVILFGDKYFWIFITVAVILLISFIIFKLFINEPKLTASNDFNVENFDITQEGPTGIKFLKTFEKGEKINLALLLASVFMCNFGYCAVSITIQNYAVIVWGMSDNLAAVLSICMGVGGAVMLVVTPFISKKVGNRMTMFISVVIIIAGFLLVNFITEFSYWIFPICAVFGGGWTAYNVVALPVVFNFSDIRNNGMFASMFTVTCNLPKAITSLTSGLMISSLGYVSLFPYTMVCMAIGGVLVLAAVLQRKSDIVRV